MKRERTPSLERKKPINSTKDGLSQLQDTSPESKDHALSIKKPKIGPATDSDESMHKTLVDSVKEIMFDTVCKGCGLCMDLDVVHCVACNVNLPFWQLCLISCGHCYCGLCFDLYIKTRSKTSLRCPMTCCKEATGPEPVQNTNTDKPCLNMLYSSQNAIGADAFRCGWAGCSLGIEALNITGKKATCSLCHRNTCTQCSQAVASGQVVTHACGLDPARTFHLGSDRKEGWRSCPFCWEIVDYNERSYNILWVSLHVVIVCLWLTKTSCRCGQSFCYHCGLPNKLCKGCEASRRAVTPKKEEPRESPQATPRFAQQTVPNGNNPAPCSTKPSKLSIEDCDHDEFYQKDTYNGYC